MGALVIRLFTRVILLLIGVALVRRSLAALPAPSRGRGQIVTWLGFIAGALILFGLLRSCVGVRI